MASLRARSLFLLENSSLKFDSSGVERRSKHDIFQSRYQLGEFHHLYDEIRKAPTKCFEYCSSALIPSATMFWNCDLKNNFFCERQLFHTQN